MDGVVANRHNNVTYSYNHSELPKTREIYAYLSVFLLGVTMTALTKLVHFSYQIPALITGISCGLLAGFTSETFNSNIVDSELMFSIFVPLVITKITYAMDNYLLLKSLPQIVIIALVGNLFYIPVYGILLRILEPNIYDNYRFLYLIIVAIILTPNGCPRVLDLDGIKNLETIMHGESLLGIVLCLTSYTVCLGVQQSVVTHWYQIVAVSLRYIGFAIPAGYIFGKITAVVFRQAFDDSKNAVCIIFATTFLVYNLCEHVLYCSGSLASFVTLYYITLERTRLLTVTDQEVKLCIKIAHGFVHTMITMLYISFIVGHWIENFDIYIVMEAFATYVISNVLRLILFLGLSPILSRIGYGFNFSSLITIFWAVQKGPIQLILAIRMHDEPIANVSENLKDKLLFYVLVYVLCTSLINSTTLIIFLKRFGLINVSNKRKANVSMAINAANETGKRVLEMLKLNRFFSDANWSIIYAQIELQNPYGIDYQDNGGWTKETVVCNSCNAVVPLEPSKEQYTEHLKAVTLRALKAQRVTFIKLHDMGFLSKLDLRILLQAVEVAMDSSNMIINVDNLFVCIGKKSTSWNLIKKMTHIFRMDSSIKIPKSGFRKICYYVATSLYFEIFIYTITLATMFLVVLRLKKYLDDHKFKNVVNILTFIDTFIVCCFLTEISLKLLGIGHVLNTKRPTVYLRNHWNKIDLIVVVVTIVHIIVAYLSYYSMVDVTYSFYLLLLRLVTCTKLFKISNRIYPKIVAYLDCRRDLTLMRAYVVAMGVVISCEDVIDSLPSFTEQSHIQGVIKSNLLKIRESVVKKMGILEKERPQLTTTVKTTQAINSILKFIRDGMFDLKTSGLIDSFECTKLNYSIIEKQKYLTSLRMIDIVQPKSIFYEIPWLCNDPGMLDYIYNNVKIKIFKEGDVLCRKNEITDGIYIIVTGYFKVTYYPGPDQLEQLKQYGHLPVKEYLGYMRFGEIQEDYLSCGNRIGELSVLTHRPYDCLVTSEAPSQAFVIPSDVLDKAMVLSADPVLGLSARMWKCVLIGLARRILLTTPAYQTASPDQIDYALFRAIVPNINYYNVVVIPQLVEDVLLLKGFVIDYTCRDVYTAPCLIPKHVTRLVIPPQSTIETKLMFIPANNIDVYEMMQTIEINSDLNTDHGSLMLNEEGKGTSKGILESHMFNVRKPLTGIALYDPKISIDERKSSTSTLRRKASIVYSQQS